jgi:hypothetical protein
MRPPVLWMPVVRPRADGGDVTASDHLHLIREKRPTVQYDEDPTFRTVEVWCPHCGKPLYLVHLELPPIDPKPKDKRGP